MGKIRSWSDEDLAKAVKDSYSIRSVIIKLNLVPAGGNYNQVQDRIKKLKLDVSHFTGKGWNVGLRFDPRPPRLPLEKVLVNGRRHQSNSLKKRLFDARLKERRCELCGWAEVSVDGRIPIELDHINGDHYDNRLENLRILCPNCHSLQQTHRGRNKKVRYKFKSNS
ncbi:HNH endonuclease [Candidatus Saccharibacteria bacterium]|nr:HNH endonuclease [Candidatus Saccharibacteria bacterium]